MFPAYLLYEMAQAVQVQCKQCKNFPIKDIV